MTDQIEMKLFSLEEDCAALKDLGAAMTDTAFHLEEMPVFLAQTWNGPAQTAFAARLGADAKTLSRYIRSVNRMQAAMQHSFEVYKACDQKVQGIIGALSFS